MLTDPAHRILDPARHRIPERSLSLPKGEVEGFAIGKIDAGYFDCAQQSCVSQHRIPEQRRRVRD